MTCSTFIYTKKRYIYTSIHMHGEVINRAREKARKKHARPHAAAAAGLGTVGLTRKAGKEERKEGKKRRTGETQRQRETRH